MTTFDEREKAFENMFAHDEALKFKAQAKGDRMIGDWAAGLLGLAGDEAEAYAKSVVIADLEEEGHEDVFRKVMADLEGKTDETALRSKMMECYAAAAEVVKAEG